MFARAHVFQRHVSQGSRLACHRTCERGASPSSHEVHRLRKGLLPPVVTKGGYFASGLIEWGRVFRSVIVVNDVKEIGSGCRDCEAEDSFGFIWYCLSLGFAPLTPRPDLSLCERILNSY